MLNVLTNPDGFFKEKSSKEVSLKAPFVIVLIAGIIGVIPVIMMFSKIMAFLPPEALPFMSIGAIIGAIGGLIGAFLVWLIFAGIFHSISIAFKGEGQFKRVFEFVGYGFIPSIISSIVGLIAIMYALPTMEFSLENPQLIQQTMLSNPAMRMSALIGILLTIWNANIWVFGMKHARNLSTRGALLTVGIPVVVYIMYSIYRLGVMF